MAIYVIDDVLEGVLPENESPSFDDLAPYSDEHLTSDDVLLVNANSMTVAVRNHAQCGGLKKLDEILSDPMQKPGGVAVIAYENLESLLKRKSDNPEVALLEPEFLPFKQLYADVTPSLDAPGALRNLAEGARGLSNQALCWRLLRLGAAHRQLQTVNASYRHEHRKLISAVRIYLGALHGGLVDLNSENGYAEAECVLKFFRSQEEASKFAQIQPHRVLQAVHRFHYFHSSVREAGGDAPTFDNLGPGWKKPCQIYDDVFQIHQQGKPFPKGFRVLLLDDNGEKLGWQFVLMALAEDYKDVEWAQNWNQAVKLLEHSIKKNNGDFDLLLLDCNLGQGKDSGLELLHALRGWSKDLPVVMMTAHDSAELALWALRSGCNGFYAEELWDESNRDSLDYFRHFCEVVRRYEWESSLRRSWRSFDSRIKARNLFGERAEPFVRSAFYLLFSLADGCTWWFHGLNLHRPNKNRETEICRAATFSLECAERESGLVVSGDRKNKLKNLFNDAKHQKTKRTLKPGRVVKDGLSAVMTAIGGSEGTAAEWGVVKWPDECRLTRDFLTSDEMPPSRAHHEQSAEGALQLVKGFAASRGCSWTVGRSYETVKEFLDLWPDPFQSDGSSSNAQVAFIDDEYDTNGWGEAVSAIMKSKGYTVHCFKSLLEMDPSGKDNFAKWDAILLDLILLREKQDLPDAHEGLRVLEHLKSTNTALPVIVLSASNESLHGLGCAKRGAFDYIPKWLPGETTEKQWQDFARLFENRTEAAIRFSATEVPQLWKLFYDKLSDSTLPTIPEDLFTEIDDPDFGYNSLAEIRSMARSLLFMALLRYHTAQSRGMARQCPPADDWRIREVLGSRDDESGEVVWTLGAVIDFLAWVSCCVVRWAEQGFSIPTTEWAKSDEIRAWTRKYSPQEGLAVWQLRNQYRNKEIDVRAVNLVTLITNTITAIEQFEAWLVGNQKDILCKRKTKMSDLRP